MLWSDNYHVDCGDDEDDDNAGDDMIFASHPITMKFITMLVNLESYVQGTKWIKRMIVKKIVLWALIISLSLAKTAKALRGEKRTTRLHRLCSGKIKLRDEWKKDKIIYDKIICGMFTKNDEYKKHEAHVARLISGQTNKTLDEQKAELIKAVNQMAQAAGPLPDLNINMIKG